ncbi:hypothetical protein [Streptomyces sp. NPDC050982]|uniref:MmyB family transcriptional regulator n=1 Tax=Streptomyces sp. NPDC050982 TaxID=3154746 RepID=UPI0033D95A56
MSIDYCTHIERGKESRPSPSIIDAPARVLLLDEREHAHLRDLAVCAARTTAPALAAAPTSSIGPGIEFPLESLRPNPAVVVSRTMDLLAWNPGGQWSCSTCWGRSRSPRGHRHTTTRSWLWRTRPLLPRPRRDPRPRHDLARGVLPWCAATDQNVGRRGGTPDTERAETVCAVRRGALLFPRTRLPRTARPATRVRQAECWTTD